jgi:hypothetical protein
MREGVRGLRNWQTFQEVVVVVDVVIVLMQSDISLLKIMIQLLSLSILFIAIARGHSCRRRIHFLHKPLFSEKFFSLPPQDTIHTSSRQQRSEKILEEMRNFL